MTPKMVNVVVGGLSVSPPDHDELDPSKRKHAGHFLPLY